MAFEARHGAGYQCSLQDLMQLWTRNECISQGRDSRSFSPNFNIFPISWLKTQHSKNEDRDIQSHHFMANRWGNSGNTDRLFSWAPKSLQMVTAAKKLRHLLLGQKAMTNLDSIFKSRDITLPTKVHLVKAMVFLSCMDVRVEPQIKLNTEELMLLNCSVGEDSWESLGLQGDQTSPY